MNIKTLPYIILLMALTGATIFHAFIVRPSTETMVQDGLQRIAEQRNEAQSGIIQYRYASGDTGLIRGWVEEEGKLKSVNKVLVVNPDQVIISSTRGSDLDEDLAEVYPELLPVLERWRLVGSATSVIRSDEGGSLFAFTVLSDPDRARQDRRPTAFALVERDTSGASARVLKISTRNALIEFGFIFINLLIFLVLFSRGMGKQFEAVERAMRDYLQGDTNAKVDVSGTGPFAELGASINSLLDTLNSRQQQLDLQKNYIELVYASTREAIITINGDGILVEANDNAVRMFGYSGPGDLLGNSLEMLLPEDRIGRFRERLRSRMEQDTDYDIIDTRREGIGLRRDGTRFPAEAVISENMLNGERVFTFFLRDVTEEEKSKKAIENLAYRNQVSGLMNRNGLKRFIHDYVRDPDHDSDEQWLFLNLGIDRLGDINTTMGFRFGDGVIAALARVLQRDFQDFRVIAHMGSDRIMIGKPMASGSVEEVFRQQCDRIQGLDLGLNLDNGSGFSVSLGVGGVAETIGADVLDIMQSAELSLVEAKRKGPGEVHLLSEADRQSIKRRAQITSELVDAIADNQLFLTYQPKISVEDPRPVSAECLVRWRKPSGEFISPGIFIPVAESANLIDIVGVWVLEEACKTLARWQSAGDIVIPLAINVSAKQLQSPEFVGQVESMLAKYAIDPALLEIEITEYSLINDAEETEVHIRALSDLGIAISIDDFGTGQSNLATILELPINHIKIDQSFVSNALESEKGFVILHSIVRLGSTLGMKMTAEGVETRDQLECIGQMGCHQVQGYFYSKPLEDRDFQDYIRNFTPPKS